MMRFLIPALFILGAATGCTDDLPEPTLIDDVRVLAIAAGPPEVRPGEAVLLTPLVVDPLDRPVTYHWSACVIAERGVGFFGGGGQTSTSGGQGASLDDPGNCFAQLAAGAEFAQDLGNDPTAALLVPPTFFDGQRALRTAYGLPDDAVLDPELEALFLGIAGVNYMVSLAIEVDGRRIVTNKRVNVSLVSPLPDNPSNLNPTDLAFFLSKKADDADGPRVAPTPSGGRCFVAEDQGLILTREKWNIQPLNIPDPQVSYLVLLGGSTTDMPFDLVSNDETYFYSFFSTVGELDKSVSKSSSQPRTDWTIPEDAPLEADVWIVVRDARGGVAWCHSTLPVAP